MDNNQLREFVANNIKAIKEVAEIYRVHQGRPGRIHWLLSDKLKDLKLSGSHDANRAEGSPYSKFTLCEDNTSDFFEIDFDEDGILWYYTTLNQQLKDKLETKKCLGGELGYELSDEDIAEEIAKQIRAIVNVINEK